MKPLGKQSRRWWILSLLFWIAIINYFDRQSLSILAPKIQAYLHMSDRSYGNVIAGFLLASTIAYLVSGIISDRLGTRWSMMLFVTWWSLSEALTSTVHSVGALVAIRFSLGMGEPGLWVTAPKAVAEWFRNEERALAIGIYTAGATVGAVIALPIIHILTSRFPWKSVFIFDGAAGLLWVPFWIMLYRRSPTQNVDRPIAPAAETGNKLVVGRLREILGSSIMWRLLVARALTDPLWYFYLFWYPKYLYGPRHLSFAAVAKVGWVVYLFGGLGTVLGGLASGRLIRGGATPTRARRAVMTVSAVLVPLSPLAALLPQIDLAIGIAALLAMAHLSWLTNLTTLVLDIFPSGDVGTVTGLVAAGSGFGGMVFTMIIAATITRHGYLPVFWMMAFLHPVALLLIWRIPKLAGKIRAAGAEFAV